MVRSERAPPRNLVAEAALEGLLAARKTLPPSLFYDEEGCRLFYEITRLPEYYLTRTEFRLLETTAPEVAALVLVQLAVNAERHDAAHNAATLEPIKLEVAERWAGVATEGDKRRVLPKPRQVARAR